MGSTPVGALPPGFKLDEPSSDLPPGFTLDQPDALPPGFTLDKPSVSDVARQRLAHPEPLHPAETASPIREWADTPIIKPEQILGKRESRKGLIPEVAGGLVRGGANLASGLVTPSNVGIAATIAAGTAAAPVVAPLAAAGFGGLMGYQAAKQLPELTQMAEDSSVPRGDVAQRAVEVGGAALMGGAGTAGAVRGLRGLGKPPTIPGPPEEPGVAAPQTATPPSTPVQPAIGPQIATERAVVPPAATEQNPLFRSVLERHNSNGGSTTRLADGADLVGTPEFAVAKYPDKGVVLDHPPTEADIAAFAATKPDDPNVSLGTWFNQADGKHYLDWSVTTPDKAEALRIGREAKQQAIWDLAKGEEIPVPKMRRFHHYTDQPGLENLTTERYGQGALSASEKARQSPPGTYLYAEGTKPEPKVLARARERVTVEIPEDQIGDITKMQGLPTQREAALAAEGKTYAGPEYPDIYKSFAKELKVVEREPVNAPPVRGMPGIEVINRKTGEVRIIQPKGMHITGLDELSPEERADILAGRAELRAGRFNDQGRVDANPTTTTRFYEYLDTLAKRDKSPANAARLQGVQPLPGKPGPVADVAGPAGGNPPERLPAQMGAATGREPVAPSGDVRVGQPPEAAKPLKGFEGLSDEELTVRARTPETVDVGQYRVTYARGGTYVERWIAEGPTRRGHWQIVGGNKKAEIIAQAESRRGSNPEAAATATQPARLPGGIYGKGPFAQTAKQIIQGPPPPKTRYVRPPAPPQASYPGVVRTAKALARGAAETRDELRALFAPMSRTTESKVAGGLLREGAARLALKTARAEKALDQARVYFDKQAPAANMEFIDRMESGRSQASPELQVYADELRRALDERRAAVQALGTGKLESFLENYFPHIWKDRKAAEEWAGRWKNQDKSIEGAKSFLKKRTIPTTKEGLAAGLEPVSNNPVDLALLRIREMDRYVMAHDWLKQAKEKGLIKYVEATEKRPHGYAELNDKVATVYGPRHVDVGETVDAKLYRDLQDFAQAVGVKVNRKPGVGGAAGLYVPYREELITKFASPMGVLTHEIGHHIDYKYGIGRALGLGKGVKVTPEIAAIRKELVALADLRTEGTASSPAYKAYIHRDSERVANLVDAYVNHRQTATRVAPNAVRILESVIDKNSSLAKLKWMHPTLGLTENIAQVPVEGVVVKGRYTAPEEVARIFNNYLSPGLHGKTAYEAYRWAGNAMNQVQLGLSAFHAGMTSIDAMVSNAALGLRQILAGQPIKGIGNIIKSPASPVLNVIQGHRMIREALGTGPLTRDVELLMKAGGRTKMDSFYYNQAVKSFKTAIRNGNYAGAAWRAPFAAFEAASMPMMEWLVPRQKLGSFLNLAKWEIERLGPNATPEQVRYHLGRAWDSIDNRMGQLVYDNLFWNKTVKDLGMASVRSLGWNLGTVREIGGALTDVATIGKRVKGDPLSDPVFTNKMAYTSMLIMTVGTMGAVTQYLMTGKGPQEAKDYFFPKTGKKNKDGSDERLSFPSYIKDIAAVKYQGITKTAEHKIHPLLAMVYDLLQNRDWRDRAIRDTEDPLLKQGLQAAQYVFKQFVPLSVQDYLKNRKQSDTQIESLRSFVGVTRAPKYITQKQKPHNRAK